MAKSTIFAGLRRRRRALGPAFAYALLLNALLAGIFNVQAIAAAIDPLAAATTCDSSGPSLDGDPVRHNSQHQPDCTFCGPACPMGGMAAGLDSAITVSIAAPSSFGLDVGRRELGINPRSVYLSDASAQAPPAIG